MWKWKWLFVNGCKCKSMIYTMTEFLNLSQDVIDRGGVDGGGGG
jgi:hypothetical protein